MSYNKKHKKGRIFEVIYYQTLPAAKDPICY